MELMVTRSSCEGIVLDVACHSVDRFAKGSRESVVNIPHYTFALRAEILANISILWVIMRRSLECTVLQYTDLYRLSAQGSMFSPADPTCTFMLFHETGKQHQLSAELVISNLPGCLNSTISELIHMNKTFSKVVLNQSSMDTWAVQFYTNHAWTVLQTGCATCTGVWTCSPGAVPLYCHCFQPTGSSMR